MYSKVVTTNNKPILGSMHLYHKLSDVDPAIYKIIKSEKHRQSRCLEMIASENLTSTAVMQALGSCMTNKYAEGYPQARYYGGTENMDKCEVLCQKRALELFNLDSEEWGVNVQCLSGSPANFAVYNALLNVGDKIMGLKLSHGGHLSHGYNASSTSKYFSSIPYEVDTSTGLINYIGLQGKALLHRPKLIIAGTSSYSRHIDYEKIRTIAKSVEAYVLSDISHIAGLVAANIGNDPFKYSDIVTTTTHKSLRGPRGALIFYRREYAKKINSSVFPGLQGGGHFHVISAVTVALYLAHSQEFNKYQETVVKNSIALCERLKVLGYKIVSDGTNNHQFTIDLTQLKIDGARVEKIMEEVSISVNRNFVPTDDKVAHGIRIGTYALTTRGFDELDMMNVADFIHKSIVIAKKFQNLTRGRRLNEFKKYVDEFGAGDDYLTTLKLEIETFVGEFPIPGISM